MNKIDAWLTRHGLKNWLTLVVVIAFILFIILLFMFLNQGDEDT
ncbi:cell wall amidase, partial [Staphylococcus gallinarum]